jgi:hypothetical protein
VQAVTRAVRGRSRSWRYSIVIAGLAALLAALAASPASAADGGGGPVTCGPGTSCYIQITQWVHFSGDHSPGTTNVVVDIQPPACSWDPVGNAQTGSQYIVSQYAGDPPSPSDPYDQSATYQQAKEMLATGSTEAGEWYFLPDAPYDTAAQAQECAAQPLYFFAQPGEPIPGVVIPPKTLAQLAVAGLPVPKAARMYLSPVTGNTYSNLPTFARVTLTQPYHIGPDGLPYGRAEAGFNGNAATVWVEATRLQLATDDSSSTPYTNGCGYLGSTEMITDPQAVARTGANGTPDCGVTFIGPGTFNLTATLTWKTCWVPEAVDGPPPAQCTPVPGAELNPDIWTRNVTVHEIQAANGAS